jgi:3-methyladenine DNA glycosylase AlkD
MHKVVGWMLRETGKRVSSEALTGFLDRHAAAMPRMMLSYATEHLDAEDQARYRAMR